MNKRCRFKVSVLAASITNKYDENSAVVGTNKRYAAIQQFGGNVGRNKKV